MGRRFMVFILAFSLCATAFTAWIVTSVGATTVNVGSLVVCAVCVGVNGLVLATWDR